ncbi:MAG: metallophosphoesterase [Clostridia bacterium]|nr:metallophosphoesterase [Clostridia bacterium]
MALFSNIDLADDITTAKSIRFNKNGKLKIMHITDTHLDDSNIDASVWLIGKACDKEMPDIVIITGDNVGNHGDISATKGYIDKLMSVFESRKLTVAVTFGNHDSECETGMTREELMDYYNTFSCSISVDDGELLSGCGTYNIPVLASNTDDVKFNLWMFDSGSYDNEGHYANVLEDKVEWYKAKSDVLKELNGGKPVYSFAFQHTIVPEVYEALKKVNKQKLFSFPHMYNKSDYYMFDPNVKNYGTFNETPCCGYYNHGQFDAMVEKGDVLGIFTGHDHTNAFGVQYKGIDIVNSLSTRYNGDKFSTQYGYRILEVDENNTSEYTSRVEHWYDMFTREDISSLKASGDDFGVETAKDVTYKGFLRKIFENVCRGFTKLVTGRKVTYDEISK